MVNSIFLEGKLLEGISPVYPKKCRGAQFFLHFFYQACKFLKMSLKLGDTAPNFKAQATGYSELIDFHEWAGPSWTILFSHPADFSISDDRVVSLVTLSL